MTTSVVVIGQGYVGLPMALHATAAGMTVIGLDTNPRIVGQLNAGSFRDCRYRSDIAHHRERPADPLACLLLSWGADLPFRDPHAPLEDVRMLGGPRMLVSMRDLVGAVASADMVVPRRHCPKHDIGPFADGLREFLDTHGPVDQGITALRS